jgi:hypothetical protein
MGKTADGDEEDPNGANRTTTRMVTTTKKGPKGQNYGEEHG